MKKNLLQVMGCVVAAMVSSLTLSSCSGTQQDDVTAAIIDAESMPDAETRMMSGLHAFNENFIAHKRLNLDESSFDDRQKVGFATQLASAGAAIGSTMSGGRGVVLAAAALSGNAFVTTSGISASSMHRWWMECAKAIAYADVKSMEIGIAIPGGNAFRFANVPEQYRTVGMELARMQNTAFVVLSQGVSKHLGIDQIPADLTSACQNEELEQACLQCYQESLCEGEIRTQLDGVVRQVLDSYVEVIRKVTASAEVETIVDTYAREIERNITLSPRQRLTIYNILILGAYSFEYWNRLL